MYIYIIFWGFFFFIKPNRWYRRYFAPQARNFWDMDLRFSDFWKLAEIRRLRVFLRLRNDRNTSKSNQKVSRFHPDSTPQNDWNPRFSCLWCRSWPFLFSTKLLCMVLIEIRRLSMVTWLGDTWNDQKQEQNWNETRVSGQTREGSVLVRGYWGQGSLAMVPGWLRAPKCAPSTALFEIRRLRMVSWSAQTRNVSEHRMKWDSWDVGGCWPRKGRVWCKVCSPVTLHEIFGVDPDSCWPWYHAQSTYLVEIYRLSMFWCSKASCHHR